MHDLLHKRVAELWRPQGTDDVAAVLAGAFVGCNEKQSGCRLADISLPSSRH